MKTIMSWQEDINRLRNEAAKTKSKIVLLNIIDKLGEYANTPYSDQAIDAICFIIATQNEKEKDIKLYALETINRMRKGKGKGKGKEKNKNRFKISRYRNFTE